MCDLSKTLVTLGCGAETNENLTYFEQLTTISSGPCGVKVCKQNAEICQIRLDFDTFVITGPYTTTTTVISTLNGVISKASGSKEVSLVSNCLTDVFSVSDQVGSFLLPCFLSHDSLHSVLCKL